MVPLVCVFDSHKLARNIWFIGGKKKTLFLNLLFSIGFVSLCTIFYGYTDANNDRLYPFQLGFLFIGMIIRASVMSIKYGYLTDKGLKILRERLVTTEEF